MCAQRQRSNDVTSIVWFRHDLRISDNPALQSAIEQGGPVLPVFIYAPEEELPWQPGAASKWWLHHSLTALEADLRCIGLRLVLRSGNSLETLLTLAKQTNARSVFWNRRYEPVVRERDTRIKDHLRNAGLQAESYNAALLHEPWTVQNKSGKPFQVFTPFWRHCLAKAEPESPISSPRQVNAPSSWPDSFPLEALQLLPVSPDWAGGLRATWKPGATGARQQLHRFIQEAYHAYPEGRNRPGLTGTSRLSPHLHFGEISPRQVWHALKSALAQEPGWTKSQFVAELGWREFSHHLLYHFPHTTTQPLRAEFSRFRWRQNQDFLRAWQKGLTGYPLVDAGMRELWTTGWMHNRVRMIVGSFLVKDLLISWQEGARWFWDTLVDADLAQNTLGWQWIAGCGADAAPFFRIFNPTAQGEKFDPQGDYVRKWVPELAAMPDDWIHKPHAAPAEVLRRAGVLSGKTYPEPVLSHAIAREVALEAFAKIKETPAP